MPRYFAQYWMKQTFERERARSVGAPLAYLASEMYYQKAVKPEDIVYAWSVWKGELYLVGRMEVEKILVPRAAEAELGTALPAEGDYAVARDGTSTRMRFSILVPPELVRQIRFQEGVTIKTPRVDGDRPSASSFQGLRELTPNTARLLDDLLESAGSVPEPVSASNASRRESTDAAQAPGRAAPKTPAAPPAPAPPPSPAYSSPDPLVAAIRTHIPAQSWKCPSCDFRRRLLIGSVGFNMECTNPRCRSQESLAHSVLNAALEELNAHCSRCGSPVKSALGKSRYVVACSTYPRCKQIESWPELRQRLKAASTAVSPSSEEPSNGQAGV